MKNTVDMFLESASGFSMPFLAEEGKEVQISLGYGEQVHPKTGEKFNHRGLDIVCSHKPLFAMASGVVTGVGTDAVHENYLIMKYGKYDVKYGHLSEAFVNYGNALAAGQQVAVSGDFLHIEVSMAGEVLDPSEFLGMIWSNMLQLASLGVKNHYRLANMGVKVRTDYDEDAEELLQMMLRWIPSYMNDVRTGTYVPPYRVESSLRNVFAQSAERNYFFEQVPDIGNPLGLGERSAPLASKVQNLIIGDFLNYMALRHNVFLPSWGDAQKKNFLSKHPQTAI